MRDYTSWSEIDTARHCLHKHDLKYKQRWTQKREPPYLALGTDWGLLLNELYTKRDPDPAWDLLDQWRQEYGESTNYDTLEWMLEGYFEKWGDGDPAWTATPGAQIELEVDVPLPDIGFGVLYLLGYVDLLVLINGLLWVVDHKSGKQAPKKPELEMADQWTLYVWALRQMGYPVVGSIHNYAKTEKLQRSMTLDERFIRTPLHRTDREVEAVAREAAVIAHLARSENGAPRSPGEMCYRRCDFVDVCIADRRYGAGLSRSMLMMTHKQKDDQ